jgi:hypothetical protein
MGWVVNATPRGFSPGKETRLLVTATKTIYMLTTYLFFWFTTANEGRIFEAQ